MALPTEILGRVRRTLGMLMPGPRRSDLQVDYLVKQNLSPLLGRRDAAYARIDELWSQELFARSVNERLAIYAGTYALLESAIADSTAVIATLSSPDTERREQRFLAYLEFLRELVNGLNQVTGLERQLAAAEGSEAAAFVEAKSAREFAHDEHVLNESELALVSRVRELLDRARSRIARYREYTTKNFSASNAQRYEKALRAYTELYR